MLLYVSMFCYAFALAGFGVLISAVCSTQQQAFLGVFAFMMPAVLLSGYASPVEYMPGWLQAAAFVLENTWPLILIAVVTLTSANWIFRRQIA